MVRIVKHRKRGRGKTPKLKGHGLKMIYDNTLLCKAEVIKIAEEFVVYYTDLREADNDSG